MQIRVLGDLAVLVDDRAVELGPTRRRALLAAMVVDAGRVVALDVLADRVWDGAPPASPAATLHAYVSRLRSSLRRVESDGARPVSPLVTAAPGYVLRVPPEAVDAHVFEAELARARAQLTSGAVADARVSVTAALARWRGERAYADVRAEFAQAESDRLGDLLTDARALAIDVDLALGLHEQAIPAIRDLLRREPLRESLHAALMLALYRAGRQAQALEAFARLRELLLDELGVDPGPAVRDLHERILRQDTDLAPPVATPPESTTAGAPDLADLPDQAIADRIPPDQEPAPAHPTGGARLVGRDRELARLRAVLRRAAGGEVVSVSVVGEAGIGKTRLVEEAVARLGPVVVWGRCWQHEGAPVLWPWVQALEGLVDQLPAEVVARAARGRGAGVATLAPAVRGSATGAEAGPEQGAAGADAPGLDRVRLYDAVAVFLQQLVAELPETAGLVVVLEDMHWADSASRELTEYLLTGLRVGRLAVLTTVRTPTDDSSRSGTELLTALARLGRSERIDVHGLTPAAVSDYVADCTGSRLDEATADELADRTGGNPFFVAEIVRLLVTDAEATDADRLSGPTGPSGLDQVGVPDSVREVIGQRLARLPGVDRTVLQVAAVAGRTFDLNVLVEASGLAEDDVDEAIDRSTELGIVRSEPGAATRHRFVHALTQQTLLDTTGPARVRRLHGRVATALLTLRSSPTPVDVEQLAFHLAASGTEAELEQAIELCVDAAQASLAVGNAPEAESLLLRALELSSRFTGDERGRLEVRARVRLWLLYTMTGGPTTAEATGQRDRALELVRRHGGSREILGVHLAQFSRLIWLDELDLVDDLLAEMSLAAEAADDDLMRAAFHLGRGELLITRGRSAEALVDFGELDRLRDVVRDAPAGLFALEPYPGAQVRHAIALSLTKRDDEAAARAAEAERVLAQAPAQTVCYTHVMLGLRLALVDDPEGALRHTTRACELADRHGLLDAHLYLDQLHAWARERTRPGTALDDVAAAVAATEVMPSIAHRPTMRALLADVALRAGRVELAREAVALGLAEAHATGDHLSLARLEELRRAASRTTSPLA